MPTTLTDEGKKILTYLIAKLPMIEISHLSTFLTYVQVLDALGFDRHVGPTYGIALDRQGLANLAYWTIDNSLPAITGIVVDKQTHLPGQGFFEVYGRDSLEDTEWWLNEVKAAKEFDWSGH